MPFLYDDRLGLLAICASGAYLTFLLCTKLLGTSSVRRLPGPPSPSWILGHMMEYDGTEVGACDSTWGKQYGSTWRLDGGIGKDLVVTADPKALQFIFQTSSYNFLRHPHAVARTRSTFGRGVLTTDLDDHKRHRKVMLPAFALGETRALTHIFQSKAAKMAHAWAELLKRDDKANGIIDVHAWLARATLDAIGEAAFDYDFGALDESNNPLSQIFRNFLIAIMHISLYKRIAMTNILQSLPLWITRLQLRLPIEDNKRRAQVYNLSSLTAKKLLHAKQEAMGTELAQKDVMSLLVRSNASELERTRLSEEEMIGQMNSIVFAGHETTANMLTWTLYQLAKHPDIQQKLRKEIRHWLQLARENGDDYISVSDYEKMSYTTAVIKESMRLDPIVPRLLRVAAKEIVIPLSEPITGKDGQIMNSVTLQKGQMVMASIFNYNRRQELWGEDADSFRPERWLHDLDSKIKFGVYGNMGTFGAGIHACLVWRFAVYEAQSFLIEMLDKFEFQETKATAFVKRAFAGVMTPVLSTDESETCMPLRISPLH